MSWISVNSEMPKVGEVVFVLLQSKIPDVLKFTGDAFVTFDALEEEAVTHWMEVPSLQT
jgi:hypothetical protein